MAASWVLSITNSTGQPVDLAEARILHADRTAAELTAARVRREHPDFRVSVLLRRTVSTQMDGQTYMSTRRL